MRHHDKPGSSGLNRAVIERRIWNKKWNGKEDKISNMHLFITKNDICIIHIKCLRQRIIEIYLIFLSYLNFVRAFCNFWKLLIVVRLHDTRSSFCSILYEHTIVFSKTWGNLLVWGSPSLVLFTWPCLALLCLGVWRIPIYYFINKHEYPFRTLYIYYIPQGHWANRLQPVLLAIISMHGVAYFWPYKTKAGREKVRQEVALCKPGKTGSVCLGFEKNINCLVRQNVPGVLLLRDVVMY